MFFKLIRQKWLTIVLVFCLGCPGLYASTVQSISAENIVLEQINLYRKDHGLSPLVMHPILSKEATKHSQDMAEHRVPFSHDGFNDRVHRIYSHFQHPSAAAENVAYNNKDAKTAVIQWLSSRGHTKNIEGQYHFTGIGIARNEAGLTYVTQIFLRVNQS